MPELEKQIGLGRFKLLKKGDPLPKSINPTGVIVKVKEDGSIKYRRVDDMRELNAWSAKHKHKFET